MSRRADLAEHGTALCLAAFGLATGGAAVAAGSVAVLTTLGIDWWRGRDATLFDALVRDAETALAAHRDLTEDAIARAIALLKDHRRTVRLDPDRLSAAVASGDAAGYLMEKTLGDLEDEDPGTVTALRLTFGALFDAFRRHDRNRDALTQEMVMALLKDQRIEVDWRGRVEGKIDNLGARLDDIAGQSRDTLEAMALRFGDPAPEDRALPDLKAFLIEKAKDYRALKAEVAAIDDGLKRLSNLKAAAKDAIDRGDLEEVETLLARVQEVELDEAARTAELRADNALLRGRVEQAFALLSAAADSSAGIDPLEPARRRVWYMDRLYNHGLRYGGTGLALSARTIRAALATVDQDDDPLLWGRMQNHLAMALARKGERTALPAGAGLLDEAGAAFRLALRVFTEADHPVDWAKTMQNLAGALATKGERTAGPAGADLLGEAVAACRDALRVTTEADHPAQWALTREKMALAERARADHDTCADPRPHLEAALAHVEAALTVFDRDHMPFYHDRARALRNHLRARLAAP